MIEIYHDLIETDCDIISTNHIAERIGCNSFEIHRDAIMANNTPGNGLRSKHKYVAMHFWPILRQRTSNEGVDISFDVSLNITVALASL